jgi:hypothetical protein
MDLSYQVKAQIWQAGKCLEDGVYKAIVRRIDQANSLGARLGSFAIEEVSRSKDVDLSTRISLQQLRSNVQATYQSDGSQ